MIIAVDFDGTCVDHCYPDTGQDVPGAVETLQKIASQGHLIILSTMRSGASLGYAVRWFIKNEIPLFGINHNPEQSEWTSSPKVYAHMLIDDTAFGCPLIHPEGFKRSCVNWEYVLTDIRLAERDMR